MLFGEELGATITSVASCQDELGLSADQCSELLKVAQNDPNLYYALARATVLGYGTKACAAYVNAQTGVPAGMAYAPCAYVAAKVASGFEKFFSYGAPTYKSTYAKMHDSEGVFWRKCPDPNSVNPGEHWIPESGGTPARCVLNVAVLDEENAPREARYVPCDRLTPAPGSPSGHVRCRTREGSYQLIEQKKPYYRPGFYGERLSTYPEATRLSPQELLARVAKGGEMAPSAGIKVEGKKMSAGKKAAIAGGIGAGVLALWLLL